MQYTVYSTNEKCFCRGPNEIDFAMVPILRGVFVGSIRSGLLLQVLGGDCDAGFAEGICASSWAKVFCSRFA